MLAVKKIVFTIFSSEVLTNSFPYLMIYVVIGDLHLMIYLKTICMKKNWHGVPCISHYLFFYLSVTGSAIFLQKKFCRGSPICGFLIQFRPNSPPSKMTHDVPHYFYYRLIMYLIVFYFDYWNNTSKSYFYLLTCILNIQSII